MVIKGKARGGPSALATHLERRDTNEKVFVRELRGVTARDVRGALREMDAMAIGAASVRTLYHASINSAPGEYLTDEQKSRAADRLEKELGLAGQPRIIVEHLKKDRQHMHVVFLRIDTDRMIAIPDSHNYRRHELVARELEREFGHERIQGAHVEREDKARPPRTPSHAEMQQADRTGLPPQQAKARITQLWRDADSGRAFAVALEADGWVRARGDKREFVIVDAAGETHSLFRRIDGVKAADVRQRMADVDATSLPGVAEARTQQASRIVDCQAPPLLSEAQRIEVQTLKVPAVANDDVSQPLTVKGRPDLPVRQQAPHPVPDLEKPRSEPEDRPAPAMFRRLYAVAAEATQRVIGKAKDILERQPPRKHRPKVDPAPAAPRQEAPPLPIAKPPVPPQAKPRRPRMTPAEITALLDRQKARGRDYEGPSL